MFGEALSGETITTTIVLYNGDTGGELPGAPGGGVVWKLDVSGPAPRYRPESGWLHLPGYIRSGDESGSGGQIALSGKGAIRLLQVTGYNKDQKRPPASPTDPPPPSWTPSVPENDDDDDFFMFRLAALSQRSIDGGGRLEYRFEDSTGDFAVVLRAPGRKSLEICGSRPVLWGSILYTERRPPELEYYTIPARVFEEADDGTNVISIGLEGIVLRRSDGTAEARLVKVNNGGYEAVIRNVQLDQVSFPDPWLRFVGGGHSDPIRIVGQMALRTESWWANKYHFDPEVLFQEWEPR